MHGIYVKSFKLGLSLSFFLFLANVFFYLRRRKVCQNEKVKWLNAHLSIHRNSLSNKLFYIKVIAKSFHRLRHRFHGKKKIVERNRHFPLWLRFFYCIFLIFCHPFISFFKKTQEAYWSWSWSWKICTIWIQTLITWFYWWRG